MLDTQAEPILSYIPYEDFLTDLDAVAEKVGAGGWRPEFLVGVGRGGLVPAAYLSHRLDIPLLSVDVSWGVAGFADELLVKLAGKLRGGERILIIDDINDSGGTISMLREALASASQGPERLRVAVLISNVRSRAEADYWSRTIDRAEDKRWFVFPWEAQADRRTLVAEAGEVPERLG
jgi:xanthine phosphoribosyltransferase